MQKSDSIINLAKALSLFQVKVDVIGKDAENGHFKNKFASLPHILESIRVPLAESGLTFSQHPGEDDTLTTILIHAETGEYFMSKYAMTPAQKSPQGIGSAITYARRYALGAILGLIIDDDDDGNAASQPASTGPAKQPRNQQPAAAKTSDEKAIDEAIASIQACKNVDAMKEAKAKVADWIVKNNRFTTAAMAHFSAITKDKAA